MNRSRAFTFYIENALKRDWSIIHSLKKKTECNCICACSNNEETEIFGYIRFNYPKYLSVVEKLFNNRALLINDTNKYEYYTNLYANELNYFQYSNNNHNVDETESSNDNNKDSDRDKDTLIKFLVENQIQLASQIVNTQAEMTNQIVNNQSEMTKQIANICMAIAKNNPLNVGDNNNNTTNNNNNTINNTNSGNTITNNTTNNNKFNLKFFLNEQCKDAMDITEFAKTIPIGLDEVMLFKRLGHTEAVTRIIENAYNGMEITKRPMHCTDPKRETLYVKNEERWTNDETKEITEKAIGTIASRSFRQLSLWKTANPGHDEDEDKMTEYAVLVKQLLGGLTDKQMEENKKTIIRNLSRITHLKRNELTV